MKQEINLYQDLFRPQRKPLSAALMSLLLLAALFTFSGIYLFKLYQLSDLQSELQLVNSDIDKLIIEVDELAARFPARGENRLLQSELARLSEELRQREDIKTALSEHSLQNTRVFSSVLESLARKHVEGTWLTGIYINEGGQSLGFAGKTFASELVPVYIQQLAGEGSFSGLSFNVMEVNRSSQEPGTLDFQVRTKAGQL